MDAGDQNVVDTRRNEWSVIFFTSLFHSPVERELRMEWLKAIDRSLPEWMGATRMQWIPWVYAFWQLVRRNTAVLWVLSVIPFILRVKFGRKRYLVRLVPFATPKFPWDPSNGCTYNEATEDDYWIAHQPNTFSVVGSQQRLNWPPSWRAVAFGGRHYFTNAESLRRLAGYIARCGHSEDGLIFGEWQAVNPVSGIGQELSREEAHLKILGSEYFVMVEAISLTKIRNIEQVITTSIKHTELSQMWWGILSSLPPLVQIWGLNALAIALSIFIILLDLSREWIYRLYQRLFLWLRFFVKTRLLRERYRRYLLFSHLFGTQWMPTVMERQCAYRARRGDAIKIYNFSQVGSLEELSIEGGGEFLSGEHDATKTAVIRLGEGRGSAIPRTRSPFTYANAKLKVDIVVE